MAICIAPCSLSWLATSHSQRLGAQEAASHLMYFYPRFSILIPLGSPALEWRWGPPQPVGSRQQGVLLLSGSGSTPGLTMASKGCLAHKLPVEAKLHQNEGKTCKKALC